MSSISEEKVAAATTDNVAAAAEDDDSDVEMEGIDMEGIDDEEAEEEESPTAAASNLKDPPDYALDKENDKGDQPNEVLEQRAHEDHDELEAARKERMELMAAETRNVAKPQAEGDGPAPVSSQLEYLLAQSEVFAHFLAGTYLGIGSC